MRSNAPFILAIQYMSHDTSEHLKARALTRKLERRIEVVMNKLAKDVKSVIKL